MAEIKGKYLMFRGKPLVRENNTLYYGYMEDKYILFLLIMTTKKIDTADSKIKIEVPDKILVQIHDTDINKKPHEKMVKQFEKDGLFEALDIGLIWLDKYNNDKVS